MDGRREVGTLRPATKMTSRKKLTVRHLGSADMKLSKVSDPGRSHDSGGYIKWHDVAWTNTMEDGILNLT